MSGVILIVDDLNTKPMTDKQRAALMRWYEVIAPLIRKGSS